jgi:hypothetical protein
MAKPTPRRRSSRHGWLPITLLAVLGLGAVAGTLYVLGNGQWPWAVKAQTAAAQGDHDQDGKRPYPRAARSLPAFTAIQVEHLIDPKSGDPLVVRLDPAEAQKKGILDAKQILGRVLRDDREAGYVFTEKDFLPVGSPDSWTAAIPSGHSGLTVTAEQVPTLRGLKRYDRVALVAAGDVRAAGSAARNGGLTADMQRIEAEGRAFDAPTRVLVDGAIVIVPMGADKRGAAGASLAVPSEQYDTVLAAIRKGADITAVVQSGNPLVPAAPLPKADVAPPTNEIRVNNGGKAETVVLPGDKGN